MKSRKQLFRGARRQSVLVVMYRVALCGFICFAALAMSAPARANVLGQIRDSIASLWSQKAGRHQTAQQARGRAHHLTIQAETLHDRLERTQRALQDSSDSYYSLWRQMRKTEAQIVSTRHRVTIVTARYNRRRILFGRRLAAMQRSGGMTFLEIFLGSRTLSDLTRRAYLYETVTARDAQLQSDLQDDKSELENAHVSLMAQWTQRNRLQLASNHERERVARAESQQQRDLKQLNQSRYAQLAYAQAEENSSREIQNMIGQLSSRRAAIIASYEEQAARERQSQQEAEREAERQAQREAERESDDEGSDNRRSYARPRDTGYRRYRHVRVARRVRRVRYHRDEGGTLRPMPVDGLVYHDTMVPVDSAESSGGGSGGGLSESFSQEDGGASGSGNASGSDDDSWGKPVSGRLSSRYGMRYHPILRRRKLHTGDDLAARQGTPFRAAHGGRVLWSGWKKAYGNTVIIDDGRGMTTLYGHASKLGVRAGQPVKRGEYIGNVGSTGWSTGPHLHFEVRKDGKPIDPTPYLRGNH